MPNLNFTPLVINQDSLGEMVEKINSNFDIVSQAGGIKGEEGKRGAAGVPGPPGAIGAQGTQGPTGIRGTRWYFADTAIGFEPIGVMEGDYLLEGSSGIVYLRLSNGVWDSQGTITGSGAGDSGLINSFVPLTNGDVRIMKPRKTNYTLLITDIKDSLGVPTVAPFDNPDDTGDYVMGLTPANPSQKLVQETALKLYTSEGDSGSINYRKGKQLHIANSLAMLSNSGWLSQSGFSINVDWDYDIDPNLEVLRINKVSSGLGHLQNIEINSDYLKVNSKVGAEYLLLSDTLGEDVAGAIRWSTSTMDFEGYNGSNWLSLTSGGVSSSGGDKFISISLYNDNNTLIDDVLPTTSTSILKIKEGAGIKLTKVTISGDDGYEITATSPYQLDILSSTNASPIEITTTVAHNLQTGDKVRIVGHAVNTSANDLWTITYVSSTKFTLDGSTGVGVGANTGSVYIQTQEISYGGIYLDLDDGNPPISLSANSPSDSFTIVKGDGIILEDVSELGVNKFKISSEPISTDVAFRGFKHSFGQYTSYNPGALGINAPWVGPNDVENMEIFSANNNGIRDIHILPFDRPDPLMNITTFGGSLITGVDPQVGSVRSTKFQPNRAGYWRISAYGFGLHFNQNRANEIIQRIVQVNQLGAAGDYFGSESYLSPTVVGLIMKQVEGDSNDSHYIYSHTSIGQNSTIYAPPVINAYLPTAVAQVPNTGRPAYSYPWPSWSIQCNDIVYLNDGDIISIAVGVLNDYLVVNNNFIQNQDTIPLVYLSGYINATFIGE